VLVLHPEPDQDPARSPSTSGGRQRATQRGERHGSNQHRTPGHAATPDRTLRNRRTDRCRGVAGGQRGPGSPGRGFPRSAWVLGLVGFPAVLVGLQWLRARRNPTRLEATGPVGHALNLAVFLACTCPSRPATPPSSSMGLRCGWPPDAVTRVVRCWPCPTGSLIGTTRLAVPCSGPSTSWSTTAPASGQARRVRWPAASRTESRDGGRSVGTSPADRGALRPGLPPPCSDAGAGRADSGRPGDRRRVAYQPDR
jgi:hypothetical protein